MKPISTDDQLVSEALGGSKEAFAELVNRYKHKVYGLLRGMGASVPDAQDAAQETFIKAYKSLPRHDRERSFASWLYTIAGNTLRDARRKSSPDPDSCNVPTLAEESYEESPEQAYLRTEAREELLLQMQRLPDHYRDALLLRYTNDLTYEEMAQLLGVPVAKVQNDLYRAKKRLRSILEEKEAGTLEMLERG
ncbi:RNA polymerase sigma factor [Paenibacillus puerhi]|uniref:RNA polymerase sigma factor n=1 Tax=Paenibacillus puerhi TaxID=2692622 RepID=UPI00135CE3A1|nr:sigma-70 family RNA polymerase sigma factor [Paenibacillus puerhi]